MGKNKVHGSIIIGDGQGPRLYGDVYPSELPKDKNGKVLDNLTIKGTLHSDDPILPKWVRDKLSSTGNDDEAMLVGLTVLGFGGMVGLTIKKKYENYKISKEQKEKIEVFKKGKFSVLKTILERLNLSKSKKKIILTIFLLTSIGAIILGSKVKSLKKGGNNKKQKTLKR